VGIITWPLSTVVILYRGVQTLDSTQSLHSCLGATYLRSR